SEVSQPALPAIVAAKTDRSATPYAARFETRGIIGASSLRRRRAERLTTRAIVLTAHATRFARGRNRALDSPGLTRARSSRSLPRVDPEYLRRDVAAVSAGLASFGFDLEEL